MHALWDQFLENEFDLKGTRKRIAEFSRDQTLIKLEPVSKLENVIGWLAFCAAKPGKEPSHPR